MSIQQVSQVVLRNFCPMIEFVALQKRDGEEARKGQKEGSWTRYAGKGTAKSPTLEYSDSFRRRRKRSKLTPPSTLTLRLARKRRSKRYKSNICSHHGILPLESCCQSTQETESLRSSGWNRDTPWQALQRHRRRPEEG